MRKIIKTILVLLLTFFARAVLRRYAPKIVMVSGSVGKTATKDAVAAALAKRFYVRKSEKSFNTEFSVPLTILGVSNPWDNPIAWISVWKRAFALLLLPNHYPNMLVLEVGADRPGDLARMLRLATPDAVVITRLPDIPVHVEAYATPEEVREEEFSPAYALPVGAPLIVPSDDEYAFKSALRASARIITYGLTGDATVRLEGIDFHHEGGKIAGMKGRIHIGEMNEDIVVKGSVGETQLLPVAAALAAALGFEISPSEALSGLEAYEPPPGRGCLLRRKNDSLIIDDSYNASPAAVERALSTLKSFPKAKRRIAVLGDMLELGRYSVMEHERVAVLAGEAADIIATVGIRARAFASQPQGAEVISFDDSRAAANALAGMVREGDVILVKGSQSIRTERIVEALLADPLHASKLVRQEQKWKKKI